MAVWMPAAARAVAASVQGDGWRRLFDGRTLDGWRFYQEGVPDGDPRRVVRIQDGALHFLAPDRGADGTKPGHISTLDEHGDFHLRLQFRWGEARYAPRLLQRRNGGVLYHM